MKACPLGPVPCEMVDPYLFVVRDPIGKELYSAEIPACSGLISLASSLMDTVRSEHPEYDVEFCEIWLRTEHHTMSLIATAY